MAQAKKKQTSTARVVSTKTEDTPDKKPRVRKAETVRDKTAKNIAKQSKPVKQPKRRIRKTAKAVAKPFKKPFRIITWPFRLRPIRFIGRILSRILWPQYFRNSYKELKQVTWPTRRETWKMTFAVILFAIAFGLAAAGTDWVLDKVIRRIVFRA